MTYKWGYNKSNNLKSTIAKSVLEPIQLTNYKSKMLATMGLEHIKIKKNNLYLILYKFSLNQTI